MVWQKVKFVFTLRTMFVHWRAYSYLFSSITMCKVSLLIFPTGHVAGTSQRQTPWEFELVTFPFLADFPNHYTLLLQALNGALQRVYTLRLGTLQREGVPRPINQARPRGGNEENGFGESWRSGRSVRHVDGCVMGFCIGKKKQFSCVPWYWDSPLNMQNISNISLKLGFQFLFCLHE